MKRLFYFLMTAAAGLTLASCVQDLEPVSDPALGGTPVAVSFSLDVRDALTKADPASTEMDSGSGVYRLYAAAFSKEDGSLLSTSCIGGTGYEKTGTVSDGKGSITMILNKKQNYTVVFFAQKDDAYDVNFASGNVATFSFKSGLNANNPNLDAFYAVQEVTGATTSYTVTLKRPFAQLNVLVPNDDYPAGKTKFSSSLKVKAPTSFNLFTGAAGTEIGTIEFAENAISAAAFGKYAQTHTWIGMNFVLVPASGKVDILSFSETDLRNPVEIGEVPVKVNGRTNMIGELYGKETEFTFTVGTDTGFGDETESPLPDDDSGQGGQGGQGGEGGGDTPTDTEIVIAGGNTYTEAAPFKIDGSKADAPNKVTLTVNGHSFAEVEAGANGAKVTATSSDAKVATAAVSGNDVVITPVGDGKAKITVSTPAYTKASYTAQTFDFWVEITGMTSGGEGGSDTIVFAELGLENGTQYKDAFTQGSMSVQFGAGSNDGKYYTTGSGMRIYGDGWVTVSSQKAIVKIEYTFDPSEQKDGDVVKTFVPDQATFGSVDTGKYDLATQTWTGSAKSVTLTRATGTGHWRLQKVVVHYGDAGTPVDETVTATLTVSPASLNLTAGEDATITVTTNSTAKPTFASDNASVADVDANGKVTAKAAGTATITVAVAAVEGAFTAASKTVPVTVTAAEQQESGYTGAGTLASPYTVADIIKFTNTLAVGATSEKDVYFKGKISSIATNGEFTVDYGNASFYITADGQKGDEEFYVFRTLYLENQKWLTGNTQIKVGDEVVICGKVTRYQKDANSDIIPETVANNSYIYSLNGNTQNTGGQQSSDANTPETAYTVAQILEVISSLGADKVSESGYYIKGKVSEITENYAAQFGNATFKMSDDGTTSGDQFLCYRILYLDNQKWTEGKTLTVGDEVIVYGKVINYKGNTPETSQGTAFLYSFG